MPAHSLPPQPPDLPAPLAASGPANQPPAPTPDVVKTLTNGLSAYGRLYGLPNPPEQVQGILGTLLRLYRPELAPAVVDAMARQVLDGLTPEGLKQALVDRASSALAKQAHQWQQQLEQQVLGVLGAYLQQYAPALTPDSLRGTVVAVLPLLDDRPVTQAEALGMVSHLVQTFDPQGALAAAVDPAYLALAQTLALALSQKPMAEAVGETVVAYVAHYAPTLTTIGADLISAALSAVLKNQVDFNIDTQLTVVDQQLLIEQVSFELNILQQSPPPSKAASAIAHQVHSAVEAYRQGREGAVDLTAGLVSNDGLSISGWTSQRPAPTPPPLPGPLEPSPEPPLGSA
ncbi:MAG TPA: hypothetical protein VLS96_01080 [Nodosilinea sp.]|nr:hypothetical protein [Nodosilinea sp.]